jgi:NADH-quinone oxidoreductase subunit G
VVFPVAAVAEKAGTFVNWEGRPAIFGAALPVPNTSSDLQVLNSIADAMDVHLGLPDVAAARREMDGLGVGAVGPVSSAGHSGGPGLGSSAGGHVNPTPGEALLATWHSLLDAGRMQDGEPHLAGTARAAVAKMSAATAAETGVAAGAKVTVGTSRGEITVPVEITTMPDRVVWLPSNSHRCAVRSQLGAGHGTLVTVRSAQ